MKGSICQRALDDTLGSTPAASCCICCGSREPTTSTHVLSQYACTLTLCKHPQYALHIRAHTCTAVLTCTVRTTSPMRTRSPGAMALRRDRFRPRLSTLDSVARRRACRGETVACRMWSATMASNCEGAMYGAMRTCSSACVVQAAGGHARVKDEHITHLLKQYVSYTPEARTRTAV